MGFGAGYVGLFLGDESEGRTGDKGKEKTKGRSKKEWLDQTIFLTRQLSDS